MTEAWKQRPEGGGWFALWLIRAVSPELATLTAMRLHTNCGTDSYGWDGYRPFIAVLHCGGGWFDLKRFALITLAMVAARTFAMAANRLIDR